MATCPVCSTPAPSQVEGTPYWACPACQCWFQSPLPPKVFQAGQDGIPAMDDREKQANRSLAGLLVQSFLGGRPGRALDVGAGYPFLVHCLKGLGCDARGLDNLDQVPAYSRHLDVPMVQADFEAAGPEQVREWAGPGTFRLITLVHVFHQLQDPRAALARLRDLLDDDGVLFLRLPDHGVAGFEQNLTQHHYAAQPFFHCLASLQRLLEETGGRFRVAWTASPQGSGQRDIALVPVAAGTAPAGAPAEAGSRPRPGSGPRIPRIALVRPGAIGDVLMILNLVPALREKHPGHIIHVYCAPWIGQELGYLMQMAGVAAWRDCESLEAFRADYDHIFTLVGYPLADGYPERPMRRHLIQYFAEELGLAADGLPSLALSLGPMGGLPDGYATLHPSAAWSAYKNWPLERWEAVLAACPDLPVIQVGARTDPRVAGARHDFMGLSLLAAASLVANARIHLGVDSFTNHLTHYRWNGRRTPAVILWGSTQASASGYPHNVNVILGLPCQPCFREDPAISRMPRGVCIEPPGQTYELPRHACMHGIPVEPVAEAVRRLWDQGVSPV
jgi:SAM-dependent methyltransferase